MKIQIKSTIVILVISATVMGTAYAARDWKGYCPEHSAWGNYKTSREWCEEQQDKHNNSSHDGHVVAICIPS